MYDISNKMVEIHVTDSSAGAPGAGMLQQIMSDSGGSALADPILMTILLTLVIALPIIILAVVLSRKRSPHAKKVLCLTPLSMVAAVIMLPLVSLAADDMTAIDASPLQITIDKGQSLSASAKVDAVLSHDATDHVNVYAKVNSDFGGKLGNDIGISASYDSQEASLVNLSQDNALIYSTPGAIVAPVDVGFVVGVTIDESLPVGSYVGEISFLGDYVQIVEPLMGTVKFSCYSAADLSETELISKSVVVEEGTSFAAPTANQLDLAGGQCGDQFGSWEFVDSYDKDNYYSPSIFWVAQVGGQLDMVARSSVQSLFIQQGERYGKEWFYLDDIDIWAYDINAYDQWVHDWDSMLYDYSRNNDGVLPVFDGLELRWKPMK